jgi:hypothetical protein
VASNVVQRTHTVAGKTLTATLHKDEGGDAPTPDSGEEDLCTVQVSGGPVVLDEDMMELYFENTNKSGGGTIKKMEMQEDAEITLITFEDPAGTNLIIL